MIDHEELTPEVENFLAHFGVKGMKWGRRKDESGLSRKDARWIRRRGDKITAKAEKKSSRELNKYSRRLLKDTASRNKSGRLSQATVMAYNTKMAELMNQKVSKISSPSGRTVKFVAKRGEVGVLLALADQGYNMDQVRNGLHESGRVAYKQQVIDRV